jgi:hypothetical protein
MKPAPRFDFPITVRRRAWEEEKRVAHLYEDIYLVILNFSVEVSFIPEIDRSAVPWGHELLGDIDDPRSENEARWFSLLLSKYAVTPDSSRSGEEELIPPSEPTGPGGVIFYVTRKELEIFATELSRLSAQLAGIHDSRTVSELKGLEFTNFLLRRVIASKYFDEKDRNILGR